MPKNVKAILGILLVFLLGAASGALLTSTIHRARLATILNGGPAIREGFIVKRLTKELDLDGQQQDQVRGIVRDTHTAVREIRKQMRPPIEVQLDRGAQRISAVLKPEQQEKFAKITADRKARRLMEVPSSDHP